MTVNKPCALVDAALAEGLVASLAPELAAHCKGCERCRDQVAEVRVLAERMVAYKDKSLASVEDIDLSPALLARLDEGTASWRSWRRFALVAALGVLLLGVIKLRSDDAPTTAHWTAMQGAELRVGSTRTQVQGRSVSQPLPFTLATSAGQDAEIHLAMSEVRMGPATELELAAPKHYDLLRGVIEIDSRTEITLITTPQQSRVRMHGIASIEHQPESHSMKLLKRHKVLAGSAVVALVLYSGWATISSGDDETRVDAPGGVYVDENGKAHAFDPQSGKSAEDLLAVARLGAEGQSASDQNEAFEPAGAFWSEQDQVVKFRIRGEAFDADTGQPVDGFELVASPIDSQDFAQSGAVRRSFHDLQNGEFTVDGVGLGTWRVTASREGYAPVIQTLEIADLRASPYLVIPLSTSGAQISGRVIDWQGRPVAGAKIGISDCVETKKKSCNLVTSNASGDFVLDKLPEEEVYSLYAKHDRYGFATSKNMRSLVEEEAGQHITIKLSGVLRIYGRVLKGAKDTPVAGALVVGGGGQTKSSASGDYELTVPLEENPEAHVESYPGSAKRVAIHSYPDDRSVRKLEWVDAPTHSAQVRIDFHLEMSGASLVGQILDQQGQPQEGLELQLANTNGWKSQRGHETYPTLALTDAQGNYRVDNIPDQAGYMVRYRQSEDDDWNQLGYVNIEEEREVRADFQVGAAAIRGRFVSAKSGEPMAVAAMSCSRMGAERVGAKGVFALAHCYPDGRFEIVNLMPGSYQLHSKTEWMDSAVTFRPKTVEVAEAQILRDVEIEVEGEGAKTWRFRILSADNTFLLGAYIRYQVGHASTTANLGVGDNGIAEQQIDDSIDEIFLEVPGYASKALHLHELDNGEVQEVHLERLDDSGSESAELSE